LLKLHKESQKNKLAGIGETMVPTFGGWQILTHMGTFLLYVENFFFAMDFYCFLDLNDDSDEF
jgi:hypothetical protein